METITVLDIHIQLEVGLDHVPDEMYLYIHDKGHYIGRVEVKPTKQGGNGIPISTIHNPNSH